MADAPTRRSFLAAAIPAVGALGLVTLTGGGCQEAPEGPASPRPGASARPAAPRATVIDRARPVRRRPTAAAEAHRPEREDLQPGAKPHGTEVVQARRPLRNAQRFVSALLRFEVAGSTPVVQRAFGESATPALARFVLAREPRRVATGPAPAGRLVALEALPGHSAEHLEVAATIARVEDETALLLRLRHGGGVWRVTALR